MPPAHPRPKSSSSSRQQGSGKTTSSPIIIIDADTPGTSIHSSSTPEIEEIDRSTFEQSAKKRKRAKFTTDPEYYDDLPYSPQDCFTSGLDQGCWPEGTSGEFWGKVLSRWEESLAVETVEERRGWFLRDVWEFMSDEESGEGRGRRNREGGFGLLWEEEEGGRASCVGVEAIARQRCGIESA
ncbi:Hypothetical predicted protein [Lecanosticta acicola]|uniref:Uncharacterized protein n=1 Tax=Lecanosticta acicola TaxID=111012 RepID=A0AAI8YTX9_9PEZI|nr:Hypothetical predicted protein [Lecanosticta acicola]